MHEIGSENGHEEVHTSLNDKNKTSNDATMNGNGENGAREDEEDEDPNQLKLAEENIQIALKKFFEVREERNL